jgi:antitoxin component YwqK of YwqJK toxin-antitoxin module
MLAFSDIFLCKNTEFVMKLKTQLQFYVVAVLILGFVACKPKNNDIEITKYFKDGVPSEHYFVLKSDSTQKNGLYTRYYIDGKIAEKAHYKNGALDSIRTLFYDNGNIHIEEHYKMGKFDGPYKSYFMDGKLLQEGAYLNNQMHGLWKTYFQEEPHILKEEITFENGIENGLFKEYFPDGKIDREGSFLNGYENGIVKMYDSTGAVVKVYEYLDSLTPPKVVRNPM